MRHTFWAAAAATSLLLSAALPNPARADNSFQVAMSGLDNPYGLAFGPNGALYVAEAGTGGSTAAFTNGNGQAVLFGDTGAVAELLNGVQSTPITGLPSLAPSDGVEATGLQGITFDSSGNLYGVFGLGGISSQLTTLEQSLPSSSIASDLGSLVSLDPTASTATPVDNIAAYETTTNFESNNPGEKDVESNPYDLVSLSNGTFAVTDGGGDVILNASTSGALPTLITALSPKSNPKFNNGAGLGGPVYESVPTAITEGPDGNLYVGEYTGFPFIAGAANVYRINPITGISSVYATGFTGITGLTFGSNGDLYVMDQTTTGLVGPPSDAQLIQYDPSTGTQTVLGSLDPSYVPTDIAVDPSGNALYVSTLGTGANTGQVLRFSLTAVPEPSPLALLGLGIIPLVFLARKRRQGD